MTEAPARPPKILQILPALATGGVERGTVDIAAALAAAHCDAVVASAGGPMVHELERAGGRHITLPLATKSPWAIWRNAAKLAELIRREQVDIVHARSRAPAWSAYLAAKRTGRPFVTTFHGTYNFKGGLKRWYNSIMARGEPVIAISEFIARHVIDTYHVPPERVRVIPRGVDLASFDPAQVHQQRIIALAQSWRLQDGAPVIMLPGRVTRWKGHAVLLWALQRLGRREVQCVFVGSDQGREAYRQELDGLVRDLELDGLVRFVGDCRDMPAAYMLADVVVSASTDPEAFGRVAAEAGAMGRPVIATDHGGARETVLPGKSGWLVRPGDSGALAEALAQALDLDLDQRQALGLAAQEHVRGHFSRTGMCDATLAVYDEVLARIHP